MTNTFFNGPVNIEIGNSATFNLEFLSSLGVLRVPSSAALTVSYTNTSGVLQSDSVTLALNNSIWSGTWSSTSAALGLATWLATSAGSTATGGGQLRILQRQSTY